MRKHEETHASRTQGGAPTVFTPRLSQLAKRTTSGWPGIIVVLARTAAAIAAIFHLTLWVSVSAAIAAILGGLRVLQAELLVPIRLDSIEKATARLAGTKHGIGWETGTAFHLGSRRWATASYHAALNEEIRVQVGGRTMEGCVVYNDENSELAIVHTAHDWPWRVRTTDHPPDRGETIKVIGWMHRAGRERSTGDRRGKERLISLDFVVQGWTSDSSLILMGSFPPMGFGGAPAVEARTGRVVGLLTGRAEGQFAHLNETFVAPLSKLPKDFR